MRFCLPPATLKDIGTPEGMSSRATDINARGQIVGSFGVFKPPQIPIGRATETWPMPFCTREAA